MIRIIRRYFAARRMLAEINANLAVRRIARKVRNEQARRGADTALANRIDQQQQFWGIGA